MRAAVASAPGKVILHGEHAVVHGKEAVAAALDLRTTAAITVCSQSSASAVLALQLKDLDINTSLAWKRLDNAIQAKDHDLPNPPKPAQTDINTLAKLLDHESATLTSNPKAQAVVAFYYLAVRVLQALDAEQQAMTLDQDVTVTINSDLPIGAGLGSSAAFCAAVSAALLTSAGLIDQDLTDLTRAAINAWAHCGECVVHGNPSGLDNTISVYGGAVKFAKGAFTQLQPFPQLRTVIVNTKVPKSTQVQINKVSKRLAQHKDICLPLLDCLHNLTGAAVAAYTRLSVLQTQNVQTSTPLPADAHAEMVELEEEVATLVNINQHLLSSLAVSHPSIDEICLQAVRHGFTAKLTGAGGGGCVFIYIPDVLDDKQQQQLQAMLGELSKYEPVETALGADGVEVQLPATTLRL
eukprot:TRINITY_DN7223_c0_g1_i4.p1 TRINITY_DN7223_c0_g1~~TRINITY_DN7223_c0_g1_i4.p1  ORF type:complete len:410 (+),score=101.21 TRINITY_DN7223_c0_g1_i4:75-1304(+)